MFIPKTKEDLDRMIADGVEENISLDYKAADSLQKSDGKKKEIAKDVSSMANSAGGVIVYGVREFQETVNRHLPEKIDPIQRTEFSKETLEQIISSNISPKIDGLLIHPISISDQDEVVYAVEIPQSTTAHQSLKDQRYYKRHNFESVPMVDYEIRDIFSRRIHPIVEIELGIERQVIEFASTKYERLKQKANSERELKIKSKYCERSILKFWLRNTGSAYAKYVNYNVHVPLEIAQYSSEMEIKVTSDHKHLIYDGDNTHRDVVGNYFDPNGEGEPKYGPSRFHPILPGLNGEVQSLDLIDDLVLDGRVITWHVFADNAPVASGDVRLSDIRVVITEDERAENG